MSGWTVDIASVRAASLFRAPSVVVDRVVVNVEIVVEVVVVVDVVDIFVDLLGVKVSGN